MIIFVSTCNINSKAKGVKMALSLYNIPTWQTNTIYQKNSIFLYNGNYYYSLLQHNSGISFDSSKSGGVISYNGLSKANFIWSPSYNTKIQITPNIKKVQYGDGYTQRSRDGINNILLPFTITFDRRDDDETRAILHFLYSRGGAESFVWIPPSPFNVQKLFVAENFSQTKVFLDNNAIEVTMQETTS